MQSRRRAWETAALNTVDPRRLAPRPTSFIVTETTTGPPRHIARQHATAQAVPVSKRQSPHKRPPRWPGRTSSASHVV